MLFVTYMTDYEHGDSKRGYIRVTRHTPDHATMWHCSECTWLVPQVGFDIT